jgi:hypothetical protein
MKFEDLGKVQKKKDKAPVDPIQIFEKRPSVKGGFDDLWRGQAEALEKWNESHREKMDVLITLDTGAGKTVVGVLMAQSLVNEGLEGVVYSCATIDLVLQTAKEAERLGLNYTTRIEGEFSNDGYESGSAFCITTYQALFNGRTYFQRRKLPQAVIFDDAHVAEAFLRDALTLTIDSEKDKSLFNKVAALFEQHFTDVGRRSSFRDSLGVQYKTIVMASPDAVAERASELEALIQEAAKHPDPNNYRFALGHLQDRFGACAVFFGNGTCEVSPPFVPSLALPVFGKGIRRIYLSATLHSMTDFVRAFGREPSVLLQPKSDAGNGERLILSGSKYGKDGVELLSKTLIKSHKVLVAVPSYPAAKNWDFAGKPPKVKEFSDALTKFKKQTDPGAFVLVFRVDGIDLPHDTCRVMIISGLPSGTALIERYLWEFVDLRNLCATKLANRVVQLLGRINRGRNDYGVFLMVGNDLNTWLSNDRNVALLPDLIQQQVVLGRFVQENMKSGDLKASREAIEQVLGRDKGWMSFYSDNIEKKSLDPSEIAKAREAEKGMIHAALASAEYASAMWAGDISTARRVLEASIEEIARTDTRLAGWYNIWLAGAYSASGDPETAAITYRRARNQLGVNFALPVPRKREEEGEVVELNSFGNSVYSIVGPTSDDFFRKEMTKLRASLAHLEGGTFRQMEAALRNLGELIGLASTRPDNDLRTGPDVLWIDDEEESCIPFELKTEKKGIVTYFKDDIKDGHDHLSFVANEHPKSKILGMVFVGPKGKCAKDANPSDGMTLTSPEIFVGLRDQVLALLTDVRKLPPLERKKSVSERCSKPEWRLSSLYDRVKGEKFAKQ